MYMFLKEIYLKVIFKYISKVIGYVDMVKNYFKFVYYLYINYWMWFYFYNKENVEVVRVNRVDLFC